MSLLGCPGTRQSSHEGEGRGLGSEGRGQDAVLQEPGKVDVELSWVLTLGPCLGRHSCSEPQCPLVSGGTATTWGTQ